MKEPAAAERRDSADYFTLRPPLPALYAAGATFLCFLVGVADFHEATVVTGGDILQIVLLPVGCFLGFWLFVYGTLRLVQTFCSHAPAQLRGYFAAIALLSLPVLILGVMRWRAPMR